MSQPVWKFLANIGDVNPVDYGGKFVYKDETGVYPPEMAVLEVPEEGESQIYCEFRFILDKCTYVNGVLSDNQFHPEHPAWFADDIEAIEDCIGQDRGSVIAGLCSDDTLARAFAYDAIASYFGYHEFDHYPLEMSRRDAKKRFKLPG